MGLKYYIIDSCQTRGTNIPQLASEFIIKRWYLSRYFGFTELRKKFGKRILGRSP